MYEGPYHLRDWAVRPQASTLQKRERICRPRILGPPEVIPTDMKGHAEHNPASSRNMACKGKRSRSLNDLLTKPTGGPKGGKEDEDLFKQPKNTEGPVMCSFQEALFTSLRGNLQTVKKDHSADLREVHKDMDVKGKRVATLEQKADDRNKETEWLQQKELQSHTEDLENNIHMRGVPTGAEGTASNPTCWPSLASSWEMLLLRP
ncbi:hypothetical protein NDU88_005369 [Pleurodeles waltl]|uniref:Uncharacterized protein n=1 Tax=Pleurodeles waltl TaxID=8319 RepID=A0AAV7MAB2_PLEWA|nr:hypothetical protein NDU88_005369 [Pleurodeles waltl]